MSDLTNVTRDFLREFIDLYRAHPCLWKTKSKDYLDKTKKNEAYKILEEKLKSVQPDATKHTVIQKINTLRGGFRRELKKVNESKRSGAGADEVYIPTLWYYELFDFVKDQEVPRESVSNVPDDDDLSQTQSNYTAEADEAESNEIENEDPTNDTVGAEIHTPSTRIRNSGSRKKKCAEAPLTKADQILNMVGEKLSTPEDEFTIIGKNVSSKLRRMPREIRIYSEKLINDILFRAELGQIDQYTTISTITHNTASTFNQLPSNIYRNSDDNYTFPTSDSENNNNNNNYPNTNWSTSRYYSSFQPDK